MRDIKDILQDLKYVEFEWDEMDDDARTEMIQQEIDNIPENPYWVVETIESLPR